MCRKGRPGRIDRCIANLITALEGNPKLTLLASCCGHSRYPLTIVIREQNEIREIISGTAIPRYRNFYRRDSHGFYYIPEVSKAR